MCRSRFAAVATTAASNLNCHSRRRVCLRSSINLLKGTHRTSLFTPDLSFFWNRFVFDGKCSSRHKLAVCRQGEGRASSEQDSMKDDRFFCSLQYVSLRWCIFFSYFIVSYLCIVLSFSLRLFNFMSSQDAVSLSGATKTCDKKCMPQTCHKKMYGLYTLISIFS